MGGGRVQVRVVIGAVRVPIHAGQACVRHVPRGHRMPGAPFNCFPERPTRFAFSERCNAIPEKETLSFV